VTRRTRLRTISIIIGALFAGSLVVAWALLHAAPSFYAPANAADPQVASSGASVESTVARELSRVRPAASDAGTQYRSEPWTITLTHDEINAWLASRLPQWLASRDARLPEGLSNPCVEITPQGVTLGAAYASPAGEIILWQPVRLDGDRVSLGTPHAGLAPLPASITKAIDSLPELLARRTVRVEDGRTVRIDRVICGKGEVTLTCVTTR